jgi:hypothetical protein
VSASAWQQQGESTGSTNTDRRPRRQHGSDMPTYLSLGAFYAADRRRATSRERDVGLWWRGDGSLPRSYRAAYVEGTGELYVMQHEGMRGGGRVQVLGRYDSFAELHRVVAGWEDVCGDPGSIDWLLARVGRVLADAA